MKLYNRNILRKRIREINQWSTTDRDAIIWSVDTGNFYALVKIQGSATTIKAHYPRNWRVTPTWLKPGNAVRIRHRSGVQGYVEVIGHGRAIPTPIAGDTLPIPTAQEDGIITGMEVLESAIGGMNVTVNSGTYRIDGEIYTFSAPITGYVVMDDPAPMLMGGGLVMGAGATITSVALAAAPAVGYGRYDALVIGTDGTVDVITGSVSILSSEPSYPSIPSDHILIDYIFIYGGMTSIPSDAIGIRWTEPYANTADTTSSMKQPDGSYEMAWSAIDDTPVGSITVTIRNQYGGTESISETATITLVGGTGGVGVAGAGPFSASASRTIGSSAIFYYERNQLASPEFSPLITIEFENHPSLTLVFIIILLAVGGEPV